MNNARSNECELETLAQNTFFCVVQEIQYKATFYFLKYLIKSDL